MIKLLLSVTLLLLVTNIQAEGFYRSIDENGKVHYSDTPLNNAADVEKIKGSAEPSAEDSQPYEMRRASSKFPVTLYFADGCGSACDQAREYLKKRGIPVTEKKLVTVEDIDAFKKATGADQVPAMHICTNWLTGFSEIVWSQALDTAGYPKNAPYIPKTTPPAEKPKTP